MEMYGFLESDIINRFQQFGYIEGIVKDYIKEKNIFTGVTHKEVFKQKIFIKLDGLGLIDNEGIYYSFKKDIISLNGIKKGVLNNGK